MREEVAKARPPPTATACHVSSPPTACKAFKWNGTGKRKQEFMSLSQKKTAKSPTLTHREMIRQIEFGTFKIRIGMEP